MLKNPLINVVALLLKKNNIFFDKQELAFQIESHPSYPSLHAITGVLDHFNIENIAAEVPQNSETLLELPNCFIAQVETDKGTELVTVVKNKLDYFIFYPSQEKEKNTELEFLKRFTGIIVAVEDSSVENQQTSNFINILFIAVLSIIAISVFLLSNSNVFNILFFSTSLVGLLISVSIYKQELGMNSLMGNAFCSSSNEKKDCDAVLSSKGATIYKDYKLSDISLLYFLGLALATFLIAFKNLSTEILSIISIVALPITFYSIFYQFKVVKKWCFLCLSILGVLWLQASLVFFRNNLIFEFSLEPFVITTFSFLVLFYTWSLLKPKLKDFQEYKKAKLDYFKFKRNYSLFSLLLKSSRKINTVLKDVPEIVFGNKNSNLEIVIITNPFCGHCKSVHKLVGNILQKHKNEVKIIIRFNVSTKNKESDVVKITTRLLELYNIKETNICLTAMGQIYEGESVVNWLKEWGECSEKERYVPVLEKENAWCKENVINFTPEILINGQSFPKEYNRLDLVYFIEDLNEESSFKSSIKTNNKFELST
jgi:uncharacterized membrane protein